MDVSAFLRDLGLERYVEAFRDNDIDADVLPKLTAEDLIALGITSVGHRRKLQEAIAALAASDLAPVAQAGAPAEADIAKRPAEAERRQLTVMFVDLVGSTELAARLDPEDMGLVIRGYQQCCADVIKRWDGHVAKYMGDGVLAYFGWPHAHEDDAERAVRAGLDLSGAVAELESPVGEPLAARVGIATGRVMVGDLIGEGSGREEAVFGDTPNLAARLQALAWSGQVVIAEGTRRLLGDVFDLSDLGRQSVKGVAEPVQMFAVKGERPVESRFEARSGPSLLPMVGRDQELALLLERWAQAKAGEGQGVLLVGEAGIGKSRISRALLDAVGEEAHVRIRYQCSAYHSDSALWPVIQHLTHVAGIAATDRTDAKLDKLEALLAPASDATGGAAPLIANLIGLDGASRYGELRLTPQAQRARTLKALVDQLLGLAASQPVLMLLEDAHWIDPTTLELIAQCLDRTTLERVLILLTSRPDNQPSLAAHPHVTRLTLNRLSRAGVEAIVARLGGSRLPTETIGTIIARTDGVPLFVEELTKAVLETGEATVPASLHDSLMARLDRTPEVKEVAQIAACIGREFDYALLAAIAGKTEVDLRAALDKLAAAELVFRRGTPPEARYSFKHALVQDAAYEALLKRRRESVHARIAKALEEGFPQTAESQPELLAYHFTEAGRTEQAIAYWRRAGERASAGSANLEAIAYLSKGLELVDALPQGVHRDDQDLSLQMAIAVPFLATRGYSAPEVERAYRRAAELCDRLGRSLELFPVLRGLWNCYLVRSDLGRARELAEQVVALAEDQGEARRRALGHRALGSTLFYLGRFETAAERLSEGIAIDQAAEGSADDRTSLALYAERAGVVCRTNLGMSLWYLGFPDQALRTVDEGLALARRLAHAHSIAYAKVMVAMVRNCRRDFAEAVSWGDAAVEVSREHGLSQWLAMATMFRGFALAGLGRPDRGLELIREGLSAWHAIGAFLLDTQWLGYIAAVHLQAGELDQALAVLDEATAAVAATGQTYYQAELLRLRGETLARLHRVGQSEAFLTEALDLARSQHAKSPELRAATSLARLWAEQGKRTEAYDLLAAVRGWFTEGFDTADLKDAKALLEELR